MKSKYIFINYPFFLISVISSLLFWFSWYNISWVKSDFNIVVFTSLLAIITIAMIIFTFKKEKKMLEILCFFLHFIWSMNKFQSFNFEIIQIVLFIFVIAIASIFRYKAFKIAATKA